MHNIVIYGTRFCGFCAQARNVFERRGIPFEDVLVDTDPSMRAELMKKTGRSTVPQVFIDNQHIGGFEDLIEYDNSGRLDQLLCQNEPSHKLDEHRL